MPCRRRCRLPPRGPWRSRPCRHSMSFPSTPPQTALAWGCGGTACSWVGGVPARTETWVPGRVPTAYPAPSTFGGVAPSVRQAQDLMPACRPEERGSADPEASGARRALRRRIHHSDQEGPDQRPCAAAADRRGACHALLHGEAGRARVQATPPAAEGRGCREQGLPSLCLAL